NGDLIELGMAKNRLRGESAAPRPAVDADAAGVHFRMTTREFANCSDVVLDTDPRELGVACVAEGARAGGRSAPIDGDNGEAKPRKGSRSDGIVTPNDVVEAIRCDVDLGSSVDRINNRPRSI